MMMFSAARPMRRVLAALTLLAASAITACNGSDATGPNRASDPSAENFASALGVNLENMTELQPRLYMQDIVAGGGVATTVGDSILVRYTGWLRTGVQFDSNVTGRPLFGFTIGAQPQQVISGWDIGTRGMRVGGKRRLVMGSVYGYGPSGSGPIPPNATLVFDVELISIVK